MDLVFRNRLVFATMTITHRDSVIEVPDVLVDTGSATTLLDADLAEEIGILAADGERLLFMEGVGGREAVYVCTVDRIDVGDGRVHGFKLQIGEMDYGPDIKAILGLDFLMRAGALIDLRSLQLGFG